MNEKKDRIILDAAYQPQVRRKRNTTFIMLDVIIALIPAVIAAVVNFGAYPLLVIAVSVVSAVFYEWAYRKLMKKDCRIGDLSACVTGLLLALVLPANAPWWLPLVGNLFAIVVVKQLYGGIGKNFLNPALAGRAFLLASYAAVMSGEYIAPRALNAVTMATPLSYMYAGEALPAGFSIGAMFMGVIPGCIGEGCTLALIVGGLYLLIRKVISWRIPVSFLGTVAVLTLIFGHSGYESHVEWMVCNLLSGGLVLAAVFMATDYATSPVTLGGQLLYGAGCGALTVLIRYFGGFPEGVTYAILIMNLCTWAIDKAFHRSQFGVNKSQAKALGKAEKYEILAHKYRMIAEKEDY